MLKLLKTVAIISAVFFGSFAITSAATTLFPSGGGTGWGFPGGLTQNSILVGNGLNPVATSSNLTWDGSKFATTFASTTAVSVSSLTSGNCLQAGFGGLLTTVGAPCSSGSGSGTISTSSPLVSGQSVYATGPSTIASVATSTPAVTSPITYSGTLGSFIGGSSGTFACATCLTANQTITLSGAVSGSGSTAITTTYAGTLPVNLGGTGSTTLSGLLAGNGASGVKTALIGSGLTFDGTTLASTGGTPGGASSTVQYNANGDFAGNTGFTYDGTHVGIGTTTAAQLLTLSSSDTNTSLTSAGLPSISIINSNSATANNTADLVFKTADTNGATVVGTKFASVFTSHTPSAVSADLAFLTRNLGTLSEKMRILSTGAVGIGLVNPGSTLETQGTTSDATSNNFIAWNSSLANLLTIRNDGNIGIASSSPTSVLSVGGKSWFTDSIGVNVAPGNTTFNLATTSSGSVAVTVANVALTLTGANAAANNGLQASLIWSGTVNNTGSDITGGGLRNRYLVTNSSIGQNMATMFAISAKAQTQGGSMASTTNAGSFNAEMCSDTATNLVTNCFGMRVLGGTVAGTMTNHYGVFVDDLVAGTNRWGFYQVGTSDMNYFAGKTGVGSTTPGALLAVHAMNGLTYPGNNLFMVGSSTATASTTLFNILNSGNVGIGTTSPMSQLAITGDLNQYGSGFAHFGTLASRDSTYCATGKKCVGLFDTDNTLSGVNMEVGNYSRGTSAYAVFALVNDLDDASGTHYAALSFNSSIYSDTTFGTGLASPSQLQLGSPDGRVTIWTASTTDPVINFLTGGTASSNEIARFNTIGLGIGTTSPGTKLSIGGTGTGINLGTGTSTFTGLGGINLVTGAGTAGCFAINGVCVGGGGGSGTVGSGTTGQFPYYAANGTTLTATSSLFLAATGFVGVGSTTPTSVLSILGGNSTATAAPSFLGAFGGTGGVAGGIGLTGGTAIVVGGTGGAGTSGIGGTGGGITLTGGVPGASSGSTDGTGGSIVLNGGTPTTLANNATGGSIVLNAGASATSPANANAGFLQFMIAGVEKMRIDITGHIVTSGTKPTLSSCGTTNNISGNDNNGTVILNGTLVTACTMTFATAVPAGQTVDCQATNFGTTIFAGITSTSTTAVVFGLSGTVSTDTFSYDCKRHQ